MLTDKQLQAFKSQLKTRFYELREEVRQEMIDSGIRPYIELAGQVHDLEEASVADMLVDLQLAAINRHIEEIRDIDAALIRIAERSYGQCSDCGTMIHEQRLKAFPTAKRCLDCQIKYEKTHAHATQSSL